MYKCNIYFHSYVYYYLGHRTGTKQETGKFVIFVETKTEVEPKIISVIFKHNI